MNDPYQLLGVSKSATQDEIKNAYRALAKKFHPDLNPGNKEAENKFKDISHAYELIGTPEARAKFDRGEFDEAAPGGAAGAGFGGFGGTRRGPFYRRTQEGPDAGGRYTFSFGEGMDEDLFESIFGAMGSGAMGGRGASGAGAHRAGSGAGGFRAQGEDQLYRMEIDLRDAVLGAEKEIALPNGKRLAVKIPAGITDGTRLRFSGQGTPGANGAPSGDAYVEIHVRDDRRFKHEGDDLISELPISITEAVFGGEVKAPTLEGHVMLKIPPHSNTGRRLRLAGKGVFNRRTQRRGDLIVALKVMLPDSVDPELESALREWQKRHSYNPRERDAA